MILINKTKKIISSVLIISILLPTALFSTPKQATAQGFVPVNDTQGNFLLKAITKATGGSVIIDNKSWLEKLGEAVLKMVAKRILAQITQATVNWINSGFHGSPLFLENPESFFKDIRKSVVKSLVDMIGYDDFRFPFGKQTALNVIGSYKSQLETNAQYSLYNVLNNQDIVNYRTNFNYGGWNGFLINTQYPQNNYLGFNMMIGESLGSQLAGTLQAPAQKVQSALQQGMGFLSPQICKDNPAYNNGINEFLRPSFKPTAGPADESEDAYHDRIATEKAAWTTANTCPGGLTTTTPGYVAANQISNALDSPRMMTLLDGALGNSFAAIFDALLNQLLSKGLNALATTVNPGPEQDDWMYEGQTLGNSTSSFTSSLENLNINYQGHVISVNTGTNVTRAIAGGTARYSIKTPSSNSSVATASFDSTGNILTISGASTSGEASIVVQDSSNPARTTTINIEVNNPNEFITSPRSFSAGSGTNSSDTSITARETANARISGGTRPYSIATQPNTDIAQVGLYDNILFVSGVEPGTTAVTIKDSSGKSYVVPITIKASGNSLTAPVQERITLYTNGDGSTADRNIFAGGTITYTDPNVVTATYITDAATPTIRFTSIANTGTGTGTGQTRVTVRGPNQQISEYDVVVLERLRTGPQTIYQGRDSRQYLLISGGRPPYRVITYDASSSSILERTTPPWIWQNTYLFVEFSGRGTTYIEIGDSSGLQNLIVPVTR